MQNTVEERSLIDGLRNQPITLALVMRLTVERGTNLIRELEDSEDVNLVFVKSSIRKLYVSSTPPYEGQYRAERERG